MNTKATDLDRRILAEFVKPDGSRVGFGSASAVWNRLTPRPAFAAVVGRINSLRARWLLFGTGGYLEITDAGVAELRKPEPEMNPSLFGGDA